MLMKNKLNHYIIITLLIFVAIILYGYISVGFPHVHQLHVSQFGPLEVILSIVTLVIGVVLIIAGLGIYTLLTYKDRRGQDERE